DTAFGDYFGAAVAVSGSTLLVGAPRKDTDVLDSGAVYIYDISNPTNPVEIAQFVAEDAQVGDQGGGAVDLEGTVGSVAVPATDDFGSASGSVYLFDATNGQQLAKIIADDSDAGDLFGSSIAQQGDQLLIGAQGDSDLGSHRGSAYFYDISDPMNPQELAKVNASDGEDDDSFGYGIAMDGSIALVGAPRDDQDGYPSGSAYVFSLDETTAAPEVGFASPDLSLRVDAWPSPTTGNAHVSLDLESGGPTELGLIDVHGRRVSTLFRGFGEAGRHVYGIDTSNLPGGVYFVRAQLGSDVATRPLVVSR
ncbi:MAG: hypothetical protein KDA27_28635, partial [Candidatus Eisenbacteria bacterium]|nr:hypothetical protein [Candidatus Eisenbacteria bacterium]